MALIPPDAGVRLRMQTEASLLQPLAPTREIPSDLPELQTGQAFAARIVETLPDNLYKALVAGRLLTLQLPDGAKPGDSLELVVVDRTPRAIVAQQVDNRPPAAAAAAEASVPQTVISRAGQMIGQLLSAEGDSPQPAALNRGEPLVAQPPLKGADLAPALAKAVSQSGLFYEAHQAEWVAGKRPLESLQAEPHAQLPPRPEVSPTPAAPRESAAAGLPSASGTQRSAEDARTANAVVPDALRPLVQQQLDAVATQRLAWHGEVWPSQTMEFSVEREAVSDRDAAAAEFQNDRWNTTLRLTMPRLGTINAALQLSAGNLRLRVQVDSEGAAAELRSDTQALTSAMSDASINLQSLEISRGEQ